ncbi:MAG: alpha/beta hydrolase [Bradyrhizobiaceae bacterium]|nr:alpha/beta hydrolase [Bradyrhizobiaceae bacterium]
MGDGLSIEPTPTIIRTRCGPIECAVSGEGPAIVALHGGMGGHDQSWLLARSLLTDLHGFRIVAVSRPGYLGTPLGVGRTPAEQADAYAALLDSLGIAATAVATVSAGGPSALQYALRHPGKCWGLILVSACSGRLETPPEIVSRLRFMKLLARVPGFAAIMRKRAMKNPEEAARRSIPDPVVRERTLGHAEAGPLLSALQSSIFDRLRMRLPGTINDTMLFAGLAAYPVEQIAAPIMVVHGTADRVVPFTHAQSIADRAARVEMVAIDGGEHVALFTHLDEVRAKAAKFIAAHRPEV